jgi:hypothetical protein
MCLNEHVIRAFLPSLFFGDFFLTFKLDKSEKLKL